MTTFLKNLAYKYRNNKIARLFIMPIWKIYTKCLSKKQNRYFKKNAPTILFDIKTILDREGINFWLEFGTLLGAFRENDFIKHDNDIDIAVFYSDREKIQKPLEKGGLKLVRQFSCDEGINGFEQTYKYKGVFIDIFFFFKENDNSMYCNTFSALEGEVINPGDERVAVRVKKISVPYSGFKTMTFKSAEFNIPQNTEEHLKAHYGTNFMVSNAKFDYMKEATNVYFYPTTQRMGEVRHYNG